MSASDRKTAAIGTSTIPPIPPITITPASTTTMKLSDNQSCRQLLAKEWIQVEHYRVVMLTLVNIHDSSKIIHVPEEYQNARWQDVPNQQAICVANTKAIVTLKIENGELKVVDSMKLDLPDDVMNCTDLAVSPDGNYAIIRTISGEHFDKMNECHVLINRKENKCTLLERVPSSQGIKGIKCITFLSNDVIAYADKKNHIHIKHISVDTKLDNNINMPLRSIYSLQCSPDSKYLTTYGYENNLKLAIVLHRVHLSSSSSKLIVDSEPVFKVSPNIFERACPWSNMVNGWFCYQARDEFIYVVDTTHPVKKFQLPIGGDKNYNVYNIFSSKDNIIVVKKRKKDNTLTEKEKAALSEYQIATYSILPHLQAEKIVESLLADNIVSKDAAIIVGEYSGLLPRRTASPTSIATQNIFAAPEKKEETDYQRLSTATQRLLINEITKFDETQNKSIHDQLIFLKNIIHEKNIDPHNIHDISEKLDAIVDEIEKKAKGTDNSNLKKLYNYSALRLSFRAATLREYEKKFQSEEKEFESPLFSRSIVSGLNS